MTNYNKDRKKKTLITLLIILILAAIYFFFISEDNKISFKGDDKKEELKTEEEKFAEMKEELKPVYTFDEFAESNRQWSEDDFAKNASSFAQRFGSYSNQSDYGNLTDLKYIMSESMANWATGYIRDLKNNSSSVDEHYDIKTNAFLSPEVRGYSAQASRIEVLVSTDRLEVIGANSRSFKQDILITFIKEGGEWKVNSAIWQ
ncbi:MAG: hypothetical protein WC280_00375 [Patescibacteria group bacterium]